MKRLFLISFFLICNNLFTQDYPEVKSIRPRVIASSYRFEWLKNNLHSGECKETFELFKYRYENWWINDPELYLEGEDSTKWTWNWYSYWAKDESVFTGFLFRITDDQLALKRCCFILRKFLEITDTINYNNLDWYEKEEFFRKMSDAVGIVLDWCYDYLPADLRRDVIQAFYSMNKAFMEIFILSSAGNSYVSSHNAWNCVFAMQNTLVLYDAEELNVEQKEEVNLWYQVLYDKWIYGFLPVYGYYRDDDGGWNWGAAYSLWALMDQFILFDNMLIATGKNFFEDLQWVKNSINQYWYFIQPNEYCIHLGDGVTKLTLDNAVYRHSDVFRDARSMWLVQKYSAPEYLPYTKAVYFKLLYKNFEHPLVEKPNLPLDWWSDKVGLAVSRTSWDTNSVLVWFFNSPSKRAAHEHRDNNNFAIFKMAPLLIDAGDYDLYNSAHYLNYYSRTVAHNTICVYDPEEKFYYGNTLLSNDGGQIYSKALQNYDDIFKPENQRGKWILYAANGNLAYWIADASLSYDSNKLKSFVRRLLFYKPDIVVVLDHLVLNGAEVKGLEPRWLAHFVNRPVINSEPIEIIVTGHIEEYRSNEYFAQNGDGNVSIRTLLPENNYVRLIGGEGYEYWVDGVNYPPIDAPDTVGGTPGKWRIEVIPDKNIFLKDTLVFLHLITIGDANSPSRFAGEKFESDVSIAVACDSIIFIFNKKNEINAEYHLINSIRQKGSFKVVACDLKAQTLYDIFVNDIFVYSVETDTNGIVECNVALLADNNKVEIRLSSNWAKENIENLSLESCIKIMSNVIELNLPNNYPDIVEVELWNLLGKKVFYECVNKNGRIVINNISSGVYFVLIKYQNTTFYSKAMLIIY